MHSSLRYFAFAFAGRLRITSLLQHISHSDCHHPPWLLPPPSHMPRPLLTTPSIKKKIKQMVHPSLSPQRAPHHVPWCPPSTRRQDARHSLCQGQTPRPQVRPPRHGILLALRAVTVSASDLHLTVFPLIHVHRAVYHPRFTCSGTLFPRPPIHHTLAPLASDPAPAPFLAPI